MCQTELHDREFLFHYKAMQYIQFYERCVIGHKVNAIHLLELEYPLDDDSIKQHHHKDTTRHNDTETYFYLLLIIVKY